MGKTLNSIYIITVQCWASNMLGFQVFSCNTKSQLFYHLKDDATFQCQQNLDCISYKPSISYSILFFLFEVCLYIWILSFSLTCHIGRTPRFLTFYCSHCSFALSPCMCVWEFCRVVIVNPVQFSAPSFFFIFLLCHVACGILVH